VVGCGHADQLLVASFVVAEATIKRIRTLSPKQISLIVTGTENGDEDLALAEYLIDRLSGYNTNVNSFLERVRMSPEGRIFSDPTIPEFSIKDLELAMQIDRFSFAMEISKSNGDLIAKPIPV
jgi:2-phosphosulfolactate phosphatase